ncbi:MAG: Ig-like domain-containing protein, partial [Candidatus Binatia bacterium]
TLTSSEIKARLLAAVDPISSLNGITATGGRLNASRALDSDTTAPSAIVDLFATNATISSITLNWTASGDDGNLGAAGVYDIRYSTSNITNANWDAATTVTNEPQPNPAGTPESLTVTGLTLNTTYFFALKVIDDAGNISNLSNVTSSTTLSDTTPPNTFINSGPANPTSSTNAVFTFQSTEVGSTFQCRLDGAGFSACLSGKSYNGLASGSHTFEVRATDSFGNTDPTPASHTWTVDTAAPGNVQVTAPSNGQTVSGTITFMGTAQDDSGTVQKMEFYIDSATSPVCTDNVPKASGSTFQCNWNSVGKPEGLHNVTAKAYDRMGRSSSSASMPFSVDNILISLLAPNGGESWPIGTTQTIQWNSSGFTGRVKIQVSRDGGATWKRITKATANDGNYSWKVTNSASTQGRIRACSVKKPTTCDTSNANFTIQ